MTTLLLVLTPIGLVDAVNARFDQWLHAPDALDMMMQLGLGFVMLSFGFKLERARESNDDRGAGEDIGVAQSFSLGFVLVIDSMARMKGQPLIQS